MASRKELNRSSNSNRNKRLSQALLRGIIWEKSQKRELDQRSRKIIVGSFAKNTAPSHANWSNFFSSCSNGKTTTNALQAEIPMEPTMAEASDTPHMGIHTFYFQTLTNRISGGSPCHEKTFAFHHESVVLESLCCRPLTRLSRWTLAHPHTVGDAKSNSMWQRKR